MAVAGEGEGGGGEWRVDNISFTGFLFLLIKNIEF